MFVEIDDFDKDQDFYVSRPVGSVKRGLGFPGFPAHHAKGEPVGTMAAKASFETRLVRVKG